MAVKLPASAFVVLSGLAFLTLWVLMVFNGVLSTLLQTAWTTVFPDGSLLKKDYTGIAAFDFAIRILVAFFYGLSNYMEPGPYLLLVDLVATLWVINLMTLVESSRTTAKGLLRSSAFWQYAWNCSGVALCLPLYFRLHARQKLDGSFSNLPLFEAQAFPFTALWTLLLPGPLLLPALVNATPFQIQTGIAIYFLTPALCINFHIMVKNLIQDFSFLSFAKPVKTAYWIVGTASAVAHIAVVVLASSSSKIRHSVFGLYFPVHSIVKQGQSNILTAGALLFSQWDCLIIGLAVLLHATNVLRPKSIFESRLWTLGAISAIFGPGAGLAFALLVQENRTELSSR